MVELYPDVMREKVELLLHGGRICVCLCKREREKEDAGIWDEEQVWPRAREGGVRIYGYDSFIWLGKVRKAIFTAIIIY